jgi:hypothetical protein
MQAIPHEEGKIMSELFGLAPNRESVWGYDGSGTSWTQIGGPASQIYAGGYGLVVTSPSTGDLWRYMGTPDEWEQIGGPGATFAVSNSAVVGGYCAVYGLAPNRESVWVYDGSGTSWTQIGGPASEIIADHKVSIIQ